MKWRVYLSVVMQNQIILCSRRYLTLAKSPRGCTGSRFPYMVPAFSPPLSHYLNGAKILCLPKFQSFSILEHNHDLHFVKLKGMAAENPGDIFEEEDDVCPVDCVREFKTDEEFCRILEKAKRTNSLVVVDFYRTACGSCKYIAQVFSKLCRGSGDQDSSVIFLKHNVIDEYDEQSEVAERLRIKAVPLFHFYKNGLLLEAFPTRDKERILAAIYRYSSTSQDT